MKELSILFVDSVNDSLLNNFKDEEQIKDYFEINKFKASKKEMLLVPKLYLKNEIDTLADRSPNSEKEITRFYKKPSNRQRFENDLVEKKILNYLLVIL